MSDLAHAHLLAVQALLAGAPTACVNLGLGHGCSVREVIQTAERVSGRTAHVIESPRRDGDSPALVADPARARSVLGWTPQHTDLADIVRSAWEWETRRHAR